MSPFRTRIRISDIILKASSVDNRSSEIMIHWNAPLFENFTTIGLNALTAVTPSRAQTVSAIAAGRRTSNNT